MDFPSENWVFNDWEDFDTASANVVGDFTMEVFAQLRNTGRILDNFRCVLGGSRHLEIDASLLDMIPVAYLYGVDVHFLSSPHCSVKVHLLSTCCNERKYGLYSEQSL
jgi:hypothetical protein